LQITTVIEGARKAQELAHHLFSDYCLGERLLINECGDWRVPSRVWLAVWSHTTRCSSSFAFRCPSWLWVLSLL